MSSIATAPGTGPEAVPAGAMTRVQNPQSQLQRSRFPHVMPHTGSLSWMLSTVSGTPVSSSPIPLSPFPDESKSSTWVGAKQASSTKSSPSIPTTQKSGGSASGRRTPRPHFPSMSFWVPILVLEISITASTTAVTAGGPKLSPALSCQCSSCKFLGIMHHHYSSSTHSPNRCASNKTPNSSKFKYVNNSSSSRCKCSSNSNCHTHSCSPCCHLHHNMCSNISSSCSITSLDTVTAAAKFSAAFELAIAVAAITFLTLWLLTLAAMSVPSNSGNIANLGWRSGSENRGGW